MERWSRELVREFHGKDEELAYSLKRFRIGSVLNSIDAA
jgi:hypothetical protein